MLYVKLQQQVIDACCAFDGWTEFKSFSLQELRAVSSSITAIIEKVEIHSYAQKSLVLAMFERLDTFKEKLGKEYVLFI